MVEKLVSNQELDDFVSSLVPTDKGWSHSYRTVERELARLLREFEKVCVNLMKSKEVVFAHNDRNQLVAGNAGLDFLRMAGNELLGRVEDVYPEFRLHPLLKAVLDEVLEEDTLDLICNMRRHRGSEKMGCVVNKLNELIDRLRSRVTSPEIKRVVLNYQRGARKSKGKLHALVDALFRRYSKVLVVRIDLTYKLPDARPVERHNLTHSDVRRDFQALLKDMRAKLFKKNFITYAWKLEYGPRTGYHYHVVFFFNGSNVMHDVDIASQIGEHWSKRVTEGSGGCQNCNARKDKYPLKGIGLIDHRDTEKINVLKRYVLGYLLEVDYLIRPVAADKIRTFGTGALPRSVTTARGRPRRASRPLVSPGVVVEP
ncbi:MAG: inovirus-type Gp2 protein [Proteobacteria bacterium]|uniref:YagK/YfjJ domain-containing protein n=1 Tax=Aquabacterium sp. TaxID=1872578 RepID=UPI0035C76A6D|nr:inovirus-type Gp2 protein [Pseudomonadota bacterium]